MSHTARTSKPSSASPGSTTTINTGAKPAASANTNGILPPPEGIPGASPRVTKYNNTADAAPIPAAASVNASQQQGGSCPFVATNNTSTASATSSSGKPAGPAAVPDARKGSMMMSASNAGMRSPSMAGMSSVAGEMALPIHFQCEADPDDPISAWKMAMEDTTQRMFAQLRNDVERMESNINVGEQEVHGKEEEQFFTRADEMEVNNLLKRQLDEVARLEAAFAELLDERKVRKAGKLTNKRSYKEAKTRYIKIKHQEKVKQTADAVLEASEQHRRRIDQLLQLVDSKHKRQRENLLVSQDRRIKSQKAVLDLELTNVKNNLLREEVEFDWDTKLAHQRNADKLACDQLRDTQQAEMTHRKERFEMEVKSMAELAEVNIDQLREMGELEHKQKLELILLTDAVEHAREKVQLLKLTGLKHVELRKLKAGHKGQLIQLVKQHKSMSGARQKKWRDGLGAELLKLAELNSEAGSSDASMASGKASGLSRDDSRSSVGSAESGMTGLTGVSGLSGAQSNEGGVAETVTSDDTEAEVKAAEEAVQQLMSEEYAKANATWSQMQENQKQMHTRQKEDRRKLAYQHRDNKRAAELTIKTRYEEMDLAHESERRTLRKSHETAMSELVQFMHKEYLVNKSIRLADRKSFAERRLLGSVLNTVVDAVVSITPAGIITRFNLAAEKMLGYKADEIIGQNVKIITSMEHMAKHDGYLKHYLKTGQRKIIGSGRYANARRKDGSEFPVFLNLSEVREEGSVVLFTGIIQNLEAKIERETRVTRARKEKESEMEALINQLDSERFQTRDLIGKILPPSIADQLMNGEPVTPRTFTDVTVLYTDLVGFTEISSGLPPLEVVGLLNSLYLAFDSCIELYDVYKVETIGDAYMVASGVPRPNGNNHVREIAKLALHLMKAVAAIKVPGRPEAQLRMRVGIHSGPVVAGVVGRKMPRYCLFGDTVTIANKMESAGVPMKIQLSEPTYRRLEKLGGFSCESRGDVIVPGKGTFKAYFLKDMEGFTPEFPLPSKVKAPAVAPSIVAAAPDAVVAPAAPAQVGNGTTVDELENLSSLGLGGTDPAAVETQLDDADLQDQEEESAFGFGLGKVAQQDQHDATVAPPNHVDVAEAPQQPGI